jgi:hypothetical protein
MDIIMEFVEIHGYNHGVYGPFGKLSTSSVTVIELVEVNMVIAAGEGQVKDW